MPAPDRRDGTEFSQPQAPLTVAMRAMEIAAGAQQQIASHEKMCDMRYQHIDKTMTRIEVSQAAMADAIAKAQAAMMEKFETAQAELKVSVRRLYDFRFWMACAAAGMLGSGLIYYIIKYGVTPT